MYSPINVIYQNLYKKGEWDGDNKLEFLAQSVYLLWSLTNSITYIYNLYKQVRIELSANQDIKPWLSWQAMVCDNVG